MAESLAHIHSVAATQMNVTDVDVTAEHAPFTSSNSRFLAAVRAADPHAVACTPADALGTLQVALAGEEALASGQRVEVR